MKRYKLNVHWQQNEVTNISMVEDPSGEWISYQEYVTEKEDSKEIPRAIVLEIRKLADRVETQVNGE